MKPRILLVPTFYLPEHWNGIDEHLLTLTRHLESAVEFVVVCRESDGAQTAELARRSGIQLMQGPPHGTAFHRAVQAYVSLMLVARPDLVHVHTPVPGGESRVALAAKILRIPSLMTVHQVQPARVRMRSRLVNRMAQGALFDRLIAVSPDVRTSLANRAGLRESSIAVIRNGIDALPGDRCASHTPCDGTVRLLCLARLSPEKGIDILLRAFAIACRENPGLHLDIAGDGPERLALERLAVELGIECRVRFLGYVTNARHLLDGCDILVHTPHYEGFGLVIAEAMAASVPTVVTPASGGIRDLVVDGETGIIANSMSPADVAVAILRLADNPGLRARLGANGHARWRTHFTGEVMAEQTLRLYRSLLGSRRTAAG